MRAEDALNLAKLYVKKSLEGAGALKGKDGADGKSAYQTALDNGFIGTEAEWLESLKGEQGMQGIQGVAGKDGINSTITENTDNTDDVYKLDIKTATDEFTTPNLKADISKNISEHNTSLNSHNDIRIFLNELDSRLNALANSDDETLDEMKEVVAYIKDNRSLIESITTTKVNVADIIDNLITNVSNKPLSASQGVVIKNLIDTLQSELTAHINNFDIHVTTDDKTNWNNATSKINNLEVGGRNLYKGTKNFDGDAWIKDTFGSWSNDSEKYNGLTVKKNVNAWNGLCQELNVEVGEIYTFSAYVKNENENGAFTFYNNQGSRGTATSKTLNSNINVSSNTSVEWLRVIVTLEITKSGTLYPTIESIINGVYVYVCGFKVEKGNVATDWTPAPEDKADAVHTHEIADVNGLQTIADNNLYKTFGQEQQGWYRIAEFNVNDNDVAAIFGSSSNGCEITLKRIYQTNTNEEHRLLLKSTYQSQNFVSISSKAQAANQLIKKIRYVCDATLKKAYIDIYYNAEAVNWTSVHINNGIDGYNTYKWQVITPTLVEETVEGETVSTVFDIPANANPVTDLDLTIDAIQGLRAELDELRSLITGS